MKLSKKILHLCSKSVRGRLVRNQIQIDYDFKPHFQIKIAESKEELEAAFQILHDSYVEKQYMEPHASGLRITPYHILPTSTIFIVKEHKKVIGTMTVIKDAALGVPADAIFDLSFLREKQLRFAEVSGLAISPKFREKGGQRFFALVKFLWHYVTEYIPLDALVVVVNPEQQVLYDDILMFEEIKGQTKKYSFVKGADAIGRYALLKNLPPMFKKVYGAKTELKNLEKYFMEFKEKSLTFPRREYFKAMDHIMTNECLQFLFDKNPNMFEGISVEKKMNILIQFLGTPFYSSIKKLLDLNCEILFHKERKNFRFETSLQGEVLVPNVLPVHILRVSREGLAIECRDLDSVAYFSRVAAHIELKIAVGIDMWSNLVLQKVKPYTMLNPQQGFRIVQSDSLWKKYIAHLHRDLK